VGDSVATRRRHYVRDSSRLAAIAEKPIPSDIDLDPPISHAIADGWADFAETILPGIGGDKDAQAHVAFHFGAMYVLQIALHVLAARSGEEAALALGMLDAELDLFMKAHAAAVQ
jgi:hypothetical protein